MIHMKKISVVVMIISVIFLWDIEAFEESSETLASEVQKNKTEDISNIDFIKIKERFSIGDLKLPESFQKELFLYDTLSTAVEEYSSENGIEDVFKLDLEQDMLYENTQFYLSGSGETVFFEYPLEKATDGYGWEHIRFRLDGQDTVLYADVDLENQKTVIYPSECTSFYAWNNRNGNPVAYEKEVKNVNGSDLYVVSDWDDLEEEDNHFVPVYDGVYEDLKKGKLKLDYLVLQGDVSPSDWDLCNDIAVVLGRYMKENSIEDVFCFSPTDTVCRVTNMTFTCRLKGSKHTLYVDMDASNLKAHVYEVEE